MLLWASTLTMTHVLGQEAHRFLMAAAPARIRGMILGWWAWISRDLASRVWSLGALGSAALLASLAAACGPASTNLAGMRAQSASETATNDADEDARAQQIYGEVRTLLLAGATDPSCLGPLIDPERGLWYANLTQHDQVLFCSEGSPDGSDVEPEIGSFYPMGRGDRFECASDGSYCVNRPGEAGSPEPWADMAVHFAFHLVEGRRRLHAIHLFPTYEDEDLSDGWDPWEAVQSLPVDGCALQRAMDHAATDGFLEVAPGPEGAGLSVTSRCGAEAESRLSFLQAGVEGAPDCGDGICRFLGPEGVVDFHLRGQPLRVWAVASLTTSDGYSVDQASEYAEFMSDPPSRECPGSNAP